jgi:hypothetical protein
MHVRTTAVQSVIAAGYKLDYQGVRVRVLVGPRIFSSPYNPDKLLGPPSLLHNGYQQLFHPGAELHGREADQSPPSSAEVKETWIYTSTPPFIFIVYTHTFTNMHVFTSVLLVKMTSKVGFTAQCYSAVANTETRQNIQNNKNCKPTISLLTYFTPDTIVVHHQSTSNHIWASH